MRYKVSKNCPFKNLNVQYTWAGQNLYIVVYYDSDSRYGVTALLGHSEDKNVLLLLTQEGKKNSGATLTLFPTSPKMAKMFKHSFGHIQSSDYCDTQVMLMPSLTSAQWDRSQPAKLVK